MKICVTADHLIKRDHSVQIVECILEAIQDGNENAPIYTLAHREKSILGPVEQRKIHSTGLSKHLGQKIFDKTDYKKFIIVLLNLIQKFSISCQYDLVINVSSGLSHGFRLCKNSKQMTYLYSWDLDLMFSSWWQKLFRPMYEKYLIASLKRSLKVYVSHHELKDRLKTWGIESEVLNPPFKVSDFPLFPPKMFPHQLILIDPTELTVDYARILTNELKKHNVKFLFIGKDDHLNILKEELNASHFFGDRCSGESAPVYASGICLFSVSNDLFSKDIMATMAVGRPIVARKNIVLFYQNIGPKNEDQSLAESTMESQDSNVTEMQFIDVEHLSTSQKFQQWVQDDFIKIIQKIQNEDELFQGQKLRNKILKFHDLTFKSKIRKYLLAFVDA